MSASMNIADADMPIYGGLGMTFMEFPQVTNIQTSDADVVVTGVPFDMATSGRPGARFGPTGVRQASAQLVWEGARWPWSFALDNHLKVEDSGNVSFKHGEPQTLVDNLEAHISQILESGKSALTFGGDHFITLPVLRAYAKKHGPVALIHFDAHTDTYDGGSKYDHGTLFHHAVVEGLVDTEHSLQIGIRTSYNRKNHPLKCWMLPGWGITARRKPWSVSVSGWVIRGFMSVLILTALTRRLHRVPVRRWQQASALTVP